MSLYSITFSSSSNAKSMTLRTSIFPWTRGWTASLSAFNNLFELSVVTKILVYRWLCKTLESTISYYPVIYSTLILNLLPKITPSFKEDRNLSHVTQSVTSSRTQDPEIELVLRICYFIVSDLLKRLEVTVREVLGSWNAGFILVVFMDPSINV